MNDMKDDERDGREDRKSDYLFDPAATPGPQDQEIQRLERALAPFRWKAGSSQAADVTAAPRVPFTRIPDWSRRALAAAALLLLLVSVPPLLRHLRGPAGAPPSTEAACLTDDAKVALDRIEGRVRVDSTKGSAPAAEQLLAAGDRIVCEAGGSARLRVGGIGWLNLEENTRVLVAEGHADSEREGAWRLDLERGTVAASIFAAPRVFSLGTPSGLAVDLGCMYRATVDDDGNTLLTVVSGRVSFESDGRKVHVPAHASCHAWPGQGPGTPAWDKSAPEFRASVARLDAARARSDAPAVRRAIEEILITEDPRDSLTLWHLLTIPEPDLRADVFERLRELCPSPEGVTRAQCLANDADALDAWRVELEDKWW